MRFRPKRRQLLGCERLEERRLLALVVDTLIDEFDGSVTDGDISLRDAIAAAQPAESIFVPLQGTITLQHGPLVIDKPLSIIGTGRDSLKIDGGNATGILLIDDGDENVDSPVELNALTIQNGHDVQWGGIFSSEPLTVNSVNIDDNTSAETLMRSRPVTVRNEFMMVNSRLRNSNTFNPDSFTVYDSVITGNTHGVQTEQITAVGSQFTDNGRLSLGDMDVFDSKFRDNYSVLGKSSSVVESQFWRNTNLAFTDSTTIQETDFRLGGRLYLGYQSFQGNDVEFRFDRVTFADNSGAIVQWAGALTIDDSNIERNEGIDPGVVCMEHATDGSLTIRNSVVSGNSFEKSGGIISYSDQGSIRVEDSLIAENTHKTTGPAGAGALRVEGFNSTTEIVRTAVVRNDSLNAYAISVNGVLAIANSTISSNTVTRATVKAREVSISNATISHNRTGPAGAAVQSPSIHLVNSIVANSDGVDIRTSSVAYATGSILEDVGNLTIIGDGNLIGVDPQLGPLADTGGNTLTHELLSTSPAIDAAVPEVNQILVDQRGFPRGPLADIGAFESDGTETSYDFNFDGNVDVHDLDRLVLEVASQSSFLLFDLTRDGLVDRNDLQRWLIGAGWANVGAAYQVGDANLDGTVDGQDFIVWNENKFTSPAMWSKGDFNADGFTDGLDFVEWNANKFTAASLELDAEEDAQTDRNEWFVERIFSLNSGFGG